MNHGKPGIQILFNELNIEDQIIHTKFLCFFLIVQRIVFMIIIKQDRKSIW